GATFTATPPAAAITPALEPEPFEMDEPAPRGGRRRAAEPEEEDQDYRREPDVEIPADEVSAWSGVRTGLTLQVIAHAALAGGLTFLLLIVMLVLLASMSPGMFLNILVLLFIAGVLTGWILSAVAGCFFLGVPPRRSAHGLAIGTLLMGTLVLL